MSFHQPSQHQTGLRPISEALGPIVIGLDRAKARKAGESIIQNLADAGGWTAPEPDTERYRMLEAALASRGMMWAFRGAEGTHDAWSLIRHCASAATERDTIDLTRTSPGYDGVAEGDVRTAFLQWGLTETRIRHATPGDVLLFDMTGARYAGKRVEAGFHAAIMSAPGGDLRWALTPTGNQSEAKMIHAGPARAVAEAWVGPVWTDRLVAAFSFDAPGRPLRAAMARAA